MGTDPKEQVTASAAKLAVQVDTHVEGVRKLLVRSEQATQEAAVGVRDTQRRLEEIAQHVQQVAGAAAAAYQATTAAVDRFLQVKQRELAAHLAAVELHEQAAALQERLGHPQRAAQARAHAEHALELHRLAAEELAEYQRRITAAKDKAGRPPRRPA